MEENKEINIVRRRRRLPTVRQVLALKYINEGMSIRAAMRKAGYSNSTSDATDNLMRSKGIEFALDNMKQKLVDMGLTNVYMAKKFKEWIEAKKIHTSHTEPDREVPDYDVQIKAYDRWEKRMGLVEKTDDTNGKVKRTMTVTEFVLGKDDS